MAPQPDISNNRMAAYSNIKGNGRPMIRGCTMGNHGSPENTGFPEGDSLVLSVGGPAGIHADKSEANGNGCFDAKVDPSKSNNSDTTTELVAGTKDLTNTSSTESEKETKESFLSMLYYFIRDVMPSIGKFKLRKYCFKLDSLPTHH